MCEPFARHGGGLVKIPEAKRKWRALSKISFDVANLNSNGGAALST